MKQEGWIKYIIIAGRQAGRFFINFKSNFKIFQVIRFGILEYSARLLF